MTAFSLGKSTLTLGGSISAIVVEGITDGHPQIVTVHLLYFELGHFEFKLKLTLSLNSHSGTYSHQSRLNCLHSLRLPYFVITRISNLSPV